MRTSSVLWLVVCSSFLMFVSSFRSLSRPAAISAQQRRHLGRVNPFQALRLKLGATFLSAKGFGPSKEEKDPGAVPGTSLRILKYPHPQLRAENELVTEFDDKLRQLVKEMFAVMYASDGIGLAAPQVGVNKRLLVFNEDPEYLDGEMVLVNPVIVDKSDEMLTSTEGCLSFPNLQGRVVRHAWIKVEFQKLDGSKAATVFEDQPAVIFQHEYDHLDKTLFVDRLVEMDKMRMQKKLQKMIDKFGQGGAV